MVSKLWASEARIEIANPFMDKKSLYISNFQTGSVAHLAFYSMGAMDNFLGYKATEEQN